MTREQAFDVQKRHSLELMKLEGVVGHGVQEENGTPYLAVYLSKEPSQLSTELPTHLDGLPVRPVVTGPFEKQ